MYTANKKMDQDTIESRVVSMKAPVDYSPRCFNFLNDRLYFLAEGANGTDFAFVDLSKEGISSGVLTWTYLDINKNLTLSSEELLRRERLRASLGLNSYEICKESNSILLNLGSAIFIMDRDRKMKELTSSCGSIGIDVKFSYDGKYISFIRDNDLWIQNIDTLNEIRITETSLIEKSKNVGSGIAEYIMQEEFDRYTGYWWNETKLCTDEYSQILYVTIDESQVEVFNIATHGYQGKCTEFRYPLAGSKNAAFELSFANIKTSGTSIEVEHYHLVPSLRERFPWVEYIPRLGWTKMGNIWVQMLDRKQQKSHLIIIDPKEFLDKCGRNYAENHMNSTEQEGNSPELQKQQSESSLEKNKELYAEKNKELYAEKKKNLSGIKLVVEEISEYWININDLTVWLDNDHVIIGSEVLGGPHDLEMMRHLYYLTPIADQEISSNNKEKYSFNDDCNSESCDHYKKSYNIKPITCSGSWQVEPNKIWYDDKNELIYYISSIRSHLDRSLCVSSLKTQNTSSNVKQLTITSGTSDVQFDSNFTKYVINSSSLTSSPSTLVYELYKEEVSQHSVVYKQISLCEVGEPPELFKFKSIDGEILYGCYYKPKNFQNGIKYPTIVMVYGGPHVQLIYNSYRLMGYNQYFGMQRYASLGYLAVIVDGRGSSRRGLKFESKMKYSMGQFEIQDQVDGINHLIKVGLVDPSKIAITGWSYGGYLSLMALCQRPDFFKLAIAIAPVVMWEAYDTGYTERYMDTPKNNQNGYKLGSVLHYVSGFPSDPNRLLIIHGALDENVHICNTFLLIQELIKFRKPYQLQIYPAERHGIRDKESNIYLQVSILRFIMENL